MPVLACPNCSALTPRQLDTSSQSVNYYRCGECGHVWTTDKKTNALVAHVTPLGPKGPNGNPS